VAQYLGGGFTSSSRHSVLPIGRASSSIAGPSDIALMQIKIRATEGTGLCGFKDAGVNSDEIK
jgi:hypothetical protein